MNFHIFFFNWQFITGFLSIIFIDLILAGDNAVVIAIAVRSLPKTKRLKGIILGTCAAIILRIGLTFFIAQLLEISFIKLIGGLLILWIAVKLFGESEANKYNKQATTLMQAMRLIVVADISMSTDNMLAVAGVSHGNLFLLIFGLGLSIPFIVFTSNLISMLMDRFPIIIYIGVAVLARVAGEMIITDPFVSSHIHPTKLINYSVQLFFIIGVLITGWLLHKLKEGKTKNVFKDN